MASVPNQDTCVRVRACLSPVTVRGVCCRCVCVCVSGGGGGGGGREGVRMRGSAWVLDESISKHALNSVLKISKIDTQVSISTVFS